MSDSPTTAGDGKSRRSPFRWLWIVVGGLALLVLAAVLLLPALLDVERYRGRIERALREATGWEPELGSMDVSVLRGLALRVSPARLRAPDAGSAFDIGSLDVQAELLPLLRGKLEVRRIDLREPQIFLVRSEADGEWILPRGGRTAEGKTRTAKPPPLPAEREAPPEPPTAGDGGLRVAIDTVAVRDGTLRLEDRTTDPPRVYGLENLDLTVYPERAEVEATGSPLGGQGRVRANGSWKGTLAVELDAVPTDALEPFLGPGIVGRGGELSGTLTLGLPDAVRGDLVARRLLLLAGEQPVDRTTIAFDARAREGAWFAETLELDTGGARLTGSGRLFPGLDLDLTVPEAPVDEVVRASRGVFPLPLELKPPGTASAEIFLEQPEGREMQVAARGTIAVASFTAAEFLPAARDVRSAFALTRDGALEVRVLQGNVAGGPLTGVARLDQVYRPGTLSLDGKLLDAALGPLLAGFVRDAAEKIVGPAGLDARLKLDLGAEVLDARALRGGLDLSARDVRVPGWDIERAVRAKLEDKLGALAALDRGRAAAGDGKPPAERQLFEALAASVDLDTRPWTLRGFQIAGGGLSATGDGTFDPIAGAVDVRLTARFEPARSAELVARYRALDALLDAEQRIALPLRVRGPLIQPGIEVELDRVLKGKLPAAEPEEQVKSKLKDLLRKKIEERKRP